METVELTIGWPGEQRYLAVGGQALVEAMDNIKLLLCWEMFIIREGGWEAQGAGS